MPKSSPLAAALASLISTPLDDREETSQSFSKGYVGQLQSIFNLQWPIPPVSSSLHGIMSDSVNVNTLHVLSVSGSVRSAPGYLPVDREKPHARLSGVFTPGLDSRLWLAFHSQDPKADILSRRVRCAMGHHVHRLQCCNLPLTTLSLHHHQHWKLEV